MEPLDRQVRYFLRIAALGSLSRAADDLDLTQSGLSRQLASLEALVGQSLFTRTGRGVELTDAGLFLQRQTSAAYQAVDAAVAALVARQPVTQGAVRLAVVHTLTYYFMGDVVARLVSRHQKVNVSLMARSSPEVVSLVESGKADVGLVYDSAVASDGVVTRTLFDDEMCLIVPIESALHGEVDLASECPTLVGFPASYALRRMLHSSGLTPNVVAEAETVDAMLKLVSTGIGACVLPCRMPEKLLADYRLKKLRIVRPLLCRRVVAIVKAGRAHTRLVELLLADALSASASIDD